MVYTELKMLLPILETLDVLISMCMKIVIEMVARGLGFGAREGGSPRGVENNCNIR
jgi:hypothetical protein